jgi:hypothetical protein
MTKTATNGQRYRWMKPRLSNGLTCPRCMAPESPVKGHRVRRLAASGAAARGGSAPADAAPGAASVVAAAQAGSAAAAAEAVAAAAVGAPDAAAAQDDSAPVGSHPVAPGAWAAEVDWGGSGRASGWCHFRPNSILRPCPGRQIRRTRSRFRRPVGTTAGSGRRPAVSAAVAGAAAVAAAVPAGGVAAGCGAAVVVAAVGVAD